MNNFLKRLSTAIIYVILLIGSLWLGPHTSALFFGLVSIICLKEFYSLFNKTKEALPQINYGLLVGVLLFLSFALFNLDYIDPKLAVAFTPLLFISFIIEIYRKHSQPIINIALTWIGILYTIIPFCLLYSIAFFGNETYNPNLILGIFFILWLNDTGAYLIGSKLGKNKLFPSVSPNKSWEGFIGGAIFGVIAAYINSLLFPEFKIENWFIISLIVVIFGSLGDLVESAFKRSLNLKDSSNILPGHGGFLDRFDSILFAAPMVYIYLYFLGIN